MKEQIAKDLQESGLFDFVRGHIAHCRMDGGVHYFPYSQLESKAHGDNPIGPWIEADGSESILAAMGLQVFWCMGQFRLGTLTGGDPDAIEWVHSLYGAERAKRTIANNAAIAWLSKQPEWIDKLKAAIESVKGKE